MIVYRLSVIFCFIWPVHFSILLLDTACLNHYPSVRECYMSGNLSSEQEYIFMNCERSSTNLVIASIR